MAKVVLEIEDCIECPYIRYADYSCNHTKDNRAIERFENNFPVDTFVNGEVMTRPSLPVPDWCPIRIDNKPKVLEALTYDWNSEKDDHWGKDYLVHIGEPPKAEPIPNAEEEAIQVPLTLIN